MKNALIALAAVIGIGAASYGMIYVNGWFAAAREEVRHEVFTNSTTYVQGNQRALSEMCNQLAGATGSSAAGIEQAIRHQFSQIDTAAYPAVLKDCLSKVGIY